MVGAMKMEACNGGMKTAVYKKTGSEASTQSRASPRWGQCWAAALKPHCTTSSGAGKPVVGSVNTIRLVVPWGAACTPPTVAPHSTPWRTCATLAEGLACRNSAAVPVTRGVAMEVPLSTCRALSLDGEAHGTAVPGAKRDTHKPVLEKAAMLSAVVVAPTHSVPAARAGDSLHASSP